MHRDPDELAIRTRDSVKIFAVLSFVASLMTLTAWHFLGAIVLWHWEVGVVTTGALMVVVVCFKKLSVAASSTIVFACAGVVLFFSAIATNLLAQSGARFEAFTGYKLVAIAVGILAPAPAWVGFSVIAICAVAPIVHYFILPSDIQRAFVVQEPWYTLICCVIALFVFRHRLRELQLERALTRVAAEKQAVNNMAKIFFFLRNITNSPLQSIEITALLLKEHQIEQTSAGRHLERALARLRELSQTLASYERNIDWSEPASFDAVADVQRTLAR